MNRILSLIYPDVPQRMEQERVMMSASAGKSRVSEEALLEYHLYTMKRPTTIKDNQSKQIALLQENNGICRKNLVLKSGASYYYWNKSGQMYKQKGVNISVLETMPGQWQILSQSHTHKKEDASTVSWKIPVPEKGSTKLTFQVRSEI
ncbi:MAG: hypothetical protein ABIJ59_09890 [Pseudomonadota bacterium]